MGFFDLPPEILLSPVPKCGISPMFKVIAHEWQVAPAFKSLLLQGLGDG